MGETWNITLGSDLLWHIVGQNEICWIKNVEWGISTTLGLRHDPLCP
jgi:hypothetical protein